MQYPIIDRVSLMLKCICPCHHDNCTMHFMPCCDVNHTVNEYVYLVPLTEEDFKKRLLYALDYRFNAKIYSMKTLTERVWDHVRTQRKEVVLPITNDIRLPDIGWSADYKSLYDGLLKSGTKPNLNITP